MSFLNTISQRASGPLIYFMKFIIKIFREPWIMLLQHILLRKIYSSSIKKLILFFTVEINTVNGGILSISSIFEETRRLEDVHNSEVVICTLPGVDILLKYTKFENHFYIFRFTQIMRYFRNMNECMIHIPELYIKKFIENLKNKDLLILKQIDRLKINILLQNIDRIPDSKLVKELRKLGNVTCTTAHEKYTTPQTRKTLGVPLHKLSTYVSPEQYQKRKYSEKNNLMIVSLDDHPYKSRILDSIARNSPQLEIVIIKNISYKEYKKIISLAKWALTFGEGLDGYFVESIFSGAVSFSVYNPKYFTDDFKNLQTVYPDYETLEKNIFTDMKLLENENNFSRYQDKQYSLCTGYYDYSRYTENLKRFYSGAYTYE